MELGDVCQLFVVFEFQINFFVDVGFCFQVIVILQIAVVCVGIVILIFIVENVVWVSLVQVWCFISMGDVYFQCEVIV